MTAVARKKHPIPATNEYENLLEKGALLDDANSTQDQALWVNNDIQI